MKSLERGEGMTTESEAIAQFPTKVKVADDTQVVVEGKKFGPGDVIELTDNLRDEAAQWLRHGWVIPVEPKQVARTAKKPSPRGT